MFKNLMLLTTLFLSFFSFSMGHLDHEKGQHPVAKSGQMIVTYQGDCSKGNAKKVYGNKFRSERTRAQPGSLEIYDSPCKLKETQQKRMETSVGRSTRAQAGSLKTYDFL